MSDPTPEPWKLDAMGHGSFVTGPTRTEATSHGAVVLNIIARTDWGRGGEDEANARLIVAATEYIRRRAAAGDVEALQILESINDRDSDQEQA